MWFRSVLGFCTLVSIIWTRLHRTVRDWASACYQVVISEPRGLVYIGIPCTVFKIQFLIFFFIRFFFSFYEVFTWAKITNKAYPYIHQILLRIFTLQLTIWINFFHIFFKYKIHVCSRMFASISIESQNASYQVNYSFTIKILSFKL